MWSIQYTNMRANEFLKEAFNQPYPAEFTDDDYAQAKDEKGKPVNISFSNWSWDGNIIKVDFDRGKGYDLTGKGDEFRVFATVVDSISKYTQQHKPPVFVFLPKNDSATRATLYKRMVNKISPSLGYVDITANPDVLADKKIATEIKKGMRKFPEADWIFIARKDLIKSPVSLSKLGFK